MRCPKEEVACSAGCPLQLHKGVQPAAPDRDAACSMGAWRCLSRPGPLLSASQKCYFTAVLVRGVQVTLADLPGQGPATHSPTLRRAGLRFGVSFDHSLERQDPPCPSLSFLMYPISTAGPRWSPFGLLEPCGAFLNHTH